MTSNHSGMNIGVLTYDYDPPIGGLGVLAKTYVSALKSSNPASRFIIISPSENADEHVSALARSRWNASGGCPLFSLLTHFALPRIIAKHRLEVLHVHAGSGGVFLLRKPTCPVVVTSHHTYHQESTLVFDQSPVKRLWKKFMSLLEQRTYKIADSIVCVSADTRAELINHYGINKKKIIVIENPIPCDELAISGNTVKDEHTILFVGRLEERKGIMLLLQAFYILVKDFPELKLMLIGRNLLGNALQEFLESHKLADRVTVLGHIDNHQRFKEMRSATLLVVPSKLEGFGLVAAEGMMMGMCVVASNAPGLRSIIDDGITGLLFQVDDINDAVRVLRDVLSDTHLRQALGMEAAARAKERFSIQKRSDDLMNALVVASAESKNK